MEKIFAVEDRFVKGPGLYGLWSLIYLVNIIVLFSDNTAGNARMFNLLSSLFSHIYLAVSAANNIWGTRKPSSMMLVAGPVHQYAFWLLFAYYGGDVFCNFSTLGVMNIVHCIVVGLFTIDMIIKSWTTTVWADDYRRYATEN